MIIFPIQRYWFCDSWISSGTLETTFFNCSSQTEKHCGWIFQQDHSRRLVFLSWRTLTCWDVFTWKSPSWRGGPRTLSFGFTSFIRSCFSPHFYPREHWPFAVHCVQCPIMFFPLPYTYLWLQQRPRRALQVAMLLTTVLFRSTRPPSYLGWCSLELLSFEQRLLSTDTAKALADLTVAPGDDTHWYFVVWLLLHRDYGLVPSRVERLHVVVPWFDLQNFIEVQDWFVRVDDLEVPKIIQATCLPVRKRFFQCSFFFFNRDSSLQVSVDDFLETTRYLRLKNLWVCLQLCPSDSVWRL